MKKNQNPIIAVVTYNTFYPYEKAGIYMIRKKPVLILPETFRAKTPESISVADPNMQLLIKHQNSLEEIIVFGGKETSGTLEIIKLFCELFKRRKQILSFLLCPHDLERKKLLLASYGIPEQQYDEFKDGHFHTKCQERKWLKGMMHDAVDMRI